MTGKDPDCPRRVSLAGRDERLPVDGAEGTMGEERERATPAPPRALLVYPLRLGDWALSFPSGPVDSPRRRSEGCGCGVSSASRWVCVVRERGQQQATPQHTTPAMSLLSPPNASTD